MMGIVLRQENIHIGKKRRIFCAELPLSVKAYVRLSILILYTGMLPEIRYSTG